MTTTAAVFRDALSTAPDPSHDAFRPSRIAAAAATALGAVGASISVRVRELRLPLGASDADAERAEAQQFALGEGPCLEALDTGRPVAGTAGELATRWPALADRWSRLTPYRSAASLPVALNGGTAALDVYLTGPDGRAHLDDDAVDVVTRLIADELDVPAAGSAWETMTPRSRRGRVWIAIGIVMARNGGEPDQALAMLRDYARAHDTDVDRVGQWLVEGSLRPDDIRT